MTEWFESDAVLLARGELAVGDLFDRHGASVFRLAYRIVNNLSDAQDVTQETFLLALRKASSIRLVGESALPWLLAATRFKAFDHLRSQRRRRTDTVERIEDLNPQLMTSDDEASSVVGPAMETLDPVDRELVELILVDGLTYAEAGDALGLTVAATGKRLQRARHHLRTLIHAERSAEGI